MKRSLRLGIAAIALSFVFASVSQAQVSTSTTFNVQATVGAILELQVVDQPVGPFPAASDLYIGTIRVLSNNALGFSLNIESANSSVLDDGGGNNIPYTMYLNQEAGNLNAPAQPPSIIGYANARTLTNPGTTYNFGPASAGSDPEFSLNLILGSYATAPMGTYADDITLLLQDL